MLISTARTKGWGRLESEDWEESHMKPTVLPESQPVLTRESSKLVQLEPSQ